MGAIRLKKNIMRVGSFQNQDGRFIVTAEQLVKWVDTFREMQADGVGCPIVKDHVENVDSAVGKVVEMAVNGEFLTAVLEFPTQELANLTLTNDVSVKAQSEYVTGVKTYRNAIRHVSLTPLPLIPGLGEYDLACSLNDYINSETQTNTTQQKGIDNTMQKTILERIGRRFGVSVPENALEDEQTALNWLDSVLADGENLECSNKAKDADSKDEKTDDGKEDDSSDSAESKDKSQTAKKKSKNVEACGKACAKKKGKNVKASRKDKDKDDESEEDESDDDSNDSEDEEDEDSEDDDSDDSEDDEDEDSEDEDNDDSEDDIEASVKKNDKQAKKKKVPQPEDFEAIKTERDLQQRSKNIVASINATRQTQLKSYLGRPGISAEKVENWIGKYAKSEDLNICCSLQNEFDTLIEGLGAALPPSVLAPNPSFDPAQYPQQTQQDTPDGPQFSRWKEKMARRNGVK